MIKSGDNIVCVKNELKDNFGVTIFSDITIDRCYKVIYVDDNDILIIVNGYSYWFPIQWFKKMKSIRKEKLEKLNNYLY
jgi:hypothetical protein